MAKRLLLSALAILIIAGGAYIAYGLLRQPEDAPACAAARSTTNEMVWIPGGRFEMGGDTYPEEGPVREVEVPGFWIASHEVTNREFAEFVAATGYVTVAERTPDPAQYPDIPADKLVAGSAIFVAPTDMSQGFNPLSWWRFAPGADWRHPKGPDSSIEGKDDYPVVHVAYEDALAYAQWKGHELPTEAQWEYAARGGATRAKYAWGDAFSPDGQYMANTWQGIFPVQNTRNDGYYGLAPGGCYPPNGYGLYDMIGNVWEWTQSTYHDRHTAPTDPQEDEKPQPLRVIKGGSFLCAPNYCQRYRPEARHAQDTGLGTDHIGFRTVLNAPGPN